MKPTFLAGLLSAVLLSAALAAEPPPAPPPAATPTPAPAPAPTPAPAATVAVVQPPAELAGCWKEKDGEGLLRFMPGQLLTVQKGMQAPAELVSIADHTLKIRVRNHETTYKYELRGGELILSVDEGPGSWTFSRLKDVPPELEPRWPLGKPAELPDEQRQAIQKELAARMERDQAVRRAMNPPDRAKAQEMMTVDRDNTAYLKKLVMDIGWINAKRFDRPACQAAFLIVQHSGDIPLMSAALPEIEKDLLARKGDPNLAQDYALLFDRLQLMTGKKQRYGTQLGANAKGEMVVLPLEDREHVEDLRKQIGLFPLAQYLDLFKQNNHGKPVGFSD